jgi:rhodanese-related sulfurtransferase
MKQIKTIFWFVAIVVISVFFSCSGGQKQANQAEPALEQPAVQTVEINQEAQTLLNYLVETGDYVNSRDFPSLIGADATLESLSGKTLVIDLRKPEVFTKGHIKGAVNVEILGLTDFFANKIKPFEYDKIILACYSGQSSSYSTSLLRLMGYGNVYSLRWGMSGWSPKMENKWLDNISSDYEAQLDTTETPKAAPGDFPVMNTGKTTGAEIMDQRIQTLFTDYENATISADTVFSHPDKYYIINYERKDKYDAGHVPGAVRYKPNGMLGIVAEMQTIPADKEVVVYCGTGHYSAFVTAYLRLFGYNAKTLRFGNNGFMHSKMVTEKDKLSWLPFTEAEVMDYPVVK